jgi:hypothetical protein
MMMVLLIAGIGLVLAGLAAIGVGIPVKEFSFGNTMILTGAIVACTGAIVLALWIVMRELKIMAQRLGAGLPMESGAGAVLPWADADASPRNEAAEPGGFPFGQDAAAAAGNPDPSAPPPWLDESGSREPPVLAPVEPEPAVKPRRNLLFSTSSRKERERALARTADPAATDPRTPPALAPPSSPEPVEPPPATFDDAWPKSERGKAVDVAPRRSGRAPSTFTEANGGAPVPERRPLPARNEEQPPVTVLKSGVVDGMAYSLYSDGSIEAQMPEGMMRFASIDELRAHLDQRP